MGKQSKIKRPQPPSDVFLETPYGGFRPASELLDWVSETILDPSGPLHNPDHAHLAMADIGFLWAGGGCEVKGRQVLGMAETPMFRCNRWQRQRQEVQLYHWFGVLPDFVITLDAGYCADAADVEFAALVEHELYHCAQDTDAYGAPAFKRDTGRPKFTIRGHDVEEFVGVVQRYGTGEPEGALSQLVEAANSRPEVANVDIARACGTCKLRAA